MVGAFTHELADVEGLDAWRGDAMMLTSSTAFEWGGGDEVQVGGFVYELDVEASMWEWRCDRWRRALIGAKVERRVRPAAVWMFTATRV
jgi:hypothetical protein